jgi:hypothetical protein
MSLCTVFALLPSWPAAEPAIQETVQKRLDGRVKPGHEGESDSAAERIPTWRIRR